MHQFKKLLLIGVMGAVIVGSPATTIASTIVPYEKHNLTIVFTWIWKIPFSVLRWDWEKTSKVVPWPPGSTPPTNTMALLAGPDGLGSSTTFDFFEDPLHNNEIIFDDLMGNTQIYDVVSGQVTYTTGPIDAFGNADISVTDFNLAASLTSPDVFNIANELLISFEGTVDSGAIHLGQLDGPQIFSADAMGLNTDLRLQFPLSPDPNDRDGYVAPADLGGTFAVVPEPSSITLLGLGTTVLIGYGCRRRKQVGANIERDVLVTDQTKANISA